jgi:tetratricopeptide (TPR) repeat protein
VAAATIAASFFVVHPAAAWPVASVVARVDLLPAFFVLLAWLAVAPPPGREVSWPAALRCGGFFLLGLLSKESAAAFLVVPALLAAHPGQGTARRGTGRWRPLAGCLGGLAVYVAIKAAAGLPLLPGTALIDPSTNPLGALPAGRRIWAAVALSGRYLLYLILPARFSDASDYVNGPYPGPGALGVLFAGALIAAWGVSVLALLQRRSPLAAPLAFALAAFLPASNILVPIGSLYAQNFLYLPLLGLSIALAAALEERLRTPQAFRCAAIVAAPVLLVLALLAMREASIWRDGQPLFTAWTERFPRYALGWSRLGVARLEAGETAGAEVALRKAIALDARIPEAHYNLGVALALTAKDRPGYEEALQESRTALASLPDLAQARVNASHLLLKLDRPAEAEAEARQALALAPGLPQARANLSEALFRQDRFKEAAAELSPLVTSSPADMALRSAYVVALIRSDDLAAARTAAAKARADFPGQAWFEFCLARVEMRSGNKDEALALLKSSAERDPQTRDWLLRVDDFEPLAGTEAYESLRR